MAKYALVADVGPSVVSCPSRRHISKTKQDRPVVTIIVYYARRQQNIT